MERYRTARNVLIVLGLGAAIYYIPGGGRAASAFEAFLWGVFALGIAYLGMRMYRENQFRLMALGDRHRGLLYGGVGLALFCYMSRSRLWETGLGELAWFVLLGLCAYAFLEVYRHSRSY
ncbi:MAG TPA: hypothetical protein VGD00_02530 [Solirubrobacteraceae bacterium]